MIWEFKQRLFVSQRKVPFPSVENLASDAVRSKLQAHVDSIDGLPERDSPDEYPVLFERVYPASSDRREFLDNKIDGSAPSHGHFVLGALMAAKLTRLIWTTNFDPLVADACAKIFGSTGRLTTADLDRPGIGEDAVSKQRWPVEIKLHGDFRSVRLKNIREELRQQDARLRQLLVDTCQRFGLVVIGYSGRDDSVMDALVEALNGPRAFPTGFFWLHHGSGPPPSPVAQLLSEATKRDVDAALVRVHSFDETLRDIYRVCNLVEVAPLRQFEVRRNRRSPAPRPSGRLGEPNVRINALEVVEFPTECRRVECDIGGYAEVRKAVAEVDADILFTRVRAGVLVFGDDGEVRATFERYSISAFELHAIDKKRLSFDSRERELLHSALTRAICRTGGLDYIHRRGLDLLAPTDCNAPQWDGLRQLVGDLSGPVTDHSELIWREGVGTRLGWADDKLWLLVDPRIVFDGLSDSNRDAAASFARERTVRRYNRQLGALVTYWVAAMASSGELRALGVGAGMDARFRLSTQLPVSERVGA